MVVRCWSNLSAQNVFTHGPRRGFAVLENASPRPVQRIILGDHPILVTCGRPQGGDRNRDDFFYAQLTELICLRVSS